MAKSPIGSYDGLKCPHCGYDGEEPTAEGRFRFLEDVTSYHHVTCLENGILYVSDYRDLYLGGKARHQRLECRSCLREFALPKDCRVEYVFGK